MKKGISINEPQKYLEIMNNDKINRTVLRDTELRLTTAVEEDTGYAMFAFPAFSSHFTSHHYHPSPHHSTAPGDVNTNNREACSIM